MASRNKHGAEQTPLLKDEFPKTGDPAERGRRPLSPWRYLLIVFCVLVCSWPMFNDLWIKFKPDTLSKDPRKAAQQVLAASPVIVRVAWSCRRAINSRSLTPTRMVTLVCILLL